MRTVKPINVVEMEMLRAEEHTGITFVRRILGESDRLVTVYLPVRVVKRIVIDVKTGCWRCKGANSGNGYAKMKVGARDLSVHRVIYTYLVGPIPDDRPILDHKAASGCSYRDCCFIDHLEPVTVKENTERGRGRFYYFQRREA